MRVPSMLVLIAAVLALPVVGHPQSAESLPRHGLLGIAVADKSGSVFAQQVIAGSAAAQAGVQNGDIVTEVDGAPISTVAQFLVKVRRPGGQAVTLTLRRASATLTKTIVMRPAPTDVAPGIETVYGAVEVDGSLRRTLLTVPKNARAPLPAVFLIGGIGCFSIDTTSPQDPYRNVAIDLSRAGFAVLRLEKSGVGDSQGAPCPTIDYRSEYHSYEVALRDFARNPLVDPKHIYLLGHSIGTIDAPRLAASMPVAGIIVADGVGVNWFEYELLNLQRQAILSGRTPAQVDDDVSAKEFCMHRLLIERESAAQILTERPACKDFIAYPAPAEYLQQVAALNIAQAWMNVSAPTLAVYGGADFVTALSDHQRIVSIVNAKHPNTATLAVIPNMNHDLSVASSAAEFMQQFEKNTPMVYNQRFSTTIVGWLCSREHCLGAPVAAGARLRLSLTDNRIVVPVFIDKHGPFSMILDTGNGGNVIVTPEVARALHLQSRTAPAEFGAGEKAVVPRRAMLESLSLGSLRFRNLAASVIDLSQIRTHLGFRALDGVIGYSLFKDLRVEVNHDSGTVMIGLAAPPIPPNATAVPFALSDNLPEVQARVDGRVARLIVDTGDRSSLTVFNRFAARAHIYERYPSRPHVVTGFGIGGPIYADVFTLPRLQIFDRTLENVPSRASRQRSGAFATAAQDGSVGGGVLNKFNIIYDYPGRKMIVWPRDQS